MALLDRFRRATRTPAAIETSLTDQGMDSAVSFGPGRPLNPTNGYSQQPRVTDYPNGDNITAEGRAAWGRRSYDTLKGNNENYDVARFCISHKTDELRSMEPMFLAADGFTGDADGAIDAARAALEFPDRESPFDEWLAKLMEGALRYDATALYRRRNLAGDVIGLEVLDGTTIVPRIDSHGRRPLPPAPAYHERIKGQVFDWFTSDDIDFRRFRPQTDSPYGLAPIESILLTANTDLLFQWHFMQMFTAGSIPGGFMETPPDVSSPDQVAEWQDYWDAMVLGDQAKMHQLIAVPHGTTMTETKPKTFDAAFPEYLMSRTCAAYGVVPQDLGLVKDVNRATGETQTDIQFRVNTLPWVLWIQGILTRYVQRDLALPVKIDLNTGRDLEDRLADARAWDIATKGGAVSVDEWRQEVYGLAVDSERPTPRFVFSSRTGPVPLTSILAIAGPIDSETGAPVDDVPLSLVAFEGAPGVLADKSPGGSEFKRAPINPDEPGFPALERPVPGSGVVAPPAPVVKAVTAGVTAGTGVEGVDLIGGKTGTVLEGDDDGDDEDEADPTKDSSLLKAPLAAGAEEASFRRFVKARRKAGVWRDFEFTAHTDLAAHALNQGGRTAVRKAAGEIVAAGLCVQAADTGRVLMIQRALDEDDAAAGKLEFPGGCLEGVETPQDAAVREWSEETGLPLPAGSMTGGWEASNGVYVGFVFTTPVEADVPIIDGRDLDSNPDDDGDLIEAIAWWTPDLLVDNPIVRDELAADMVAVLGCLGGSGDGEPVAKAASAWEAHPVRRVETALATHHAAPIQAAIAGSVTAQQLHALAAAYVTAHPDA